MRNDKQRREQIKKQLGIGPGSARNKLIKNLLFDFSKQLGKNICFQCGKEIENEREFSIEHKIPWLNNDDAYDLYFDLENIAFSHLACNIAVARNGFKVKSKSGFKGVFHQVNRNSPKKWRAQRCGKKEGTVHIGWFETPEEAAKAYDEAIVAAFKDRKINKSIVTNEDLGLI